MPDRINNYIPNSVVLLGGQLLSMSTANQICGSLSHSSLRCIISLLYLPTFCSLLDHIYLALSLYVQTSMKLVSISTGHKYLWLHLTLPQRFVPHKYNRNNELALEIIAKKMQRKNRIYQCHCRCYHFRNRLCCVTNSETNHFCIGMLRHMGRSPSCNLVSNKKNEFGLILFIKWQDFKISQPMRN